MLQSLLSTLLFSSLVLATNSTSKYTSLVKLSFNGPVIATRAIDFSKCPSICDATKDCIGWTQKTSTSTCTFKSGLDRVQDSSEGDSFIIYTTPEASFSALIAVDTPYNDLFETSNIPFDRCASVCALDSACNAYTTHVDAKIGCWFKSALQNFTPNTSRNTFAKLSKVPRSYETHKRFSGITSEIFTLMNSIGDCSKVCDVIPGCVAFVTDTKNSNICTLQSMVSSFTPKNCRSPLVMHSISGYAIASKKKATFIQLKDVDFPYVDIKMIDSMPFEKCPNECQSTPGCVAFVLFKDNGKGCWFKGKLTTPHNQNVRDTFFMPLAPIKIYNQTTHFSGSYVELFTFTGTDVDCQTTCDNVAQCVGFLTNSAAKVSCKILGGITDRSKTDLKSTATLFTPTK